MAGIFGGRNEKAVFVKKGEAPPPTGRNEGMPSGMAGVPPGRWKKKTADVRRRTSGIRRSRKQKKEGSP